jgi:hypothetical protein
VVKWPDTYEPIVVGDGTEFGMEMSVSSPFRYAVGFETVLDPDSALREMSAFPGSWRAAGSEYPEEAQPTIEHRFENVGAADVISPTILGEIVLSDANAVRYMVPIYKSEEFGLAEFTPVPNHVVVTTTYESAFGSIDEVASEQLFFPLLHRDATIGDRFRRIYSSRISEPEAEPSEEFKDYVGEPGPALRLIDELVTLESEIDADLVAEPDWYLNHPNDLTTRATRSVDSLANSDGSVVHVALDATGVKVAVLDGEFDLSHASTKLSFGHPRRNEVESSDQVGIVNGDAHGTLCAGLICAQPGIVGFEKGGVEPTAEALPISIYRTKEPVRAELEHLVQGIASSVEFGCKIISVSVAGFPSAKTLIDAVSDADLRGTLIVAGTGNRKSGDSDGPGFVLYPARFGNVIGVGAAMVDSSDPLGPLRRVSLDTSAAADEPLRWESRYGTGIDVVAPGLLVTSTDLSGTGGKTEKDSPTGDVWNRFSGTSAATPLVAGFAAKIAGETAGSPQQIRDAIRDAAERLGPYRYARTRYERPWDWQVGFGWIDRAVIDAWEPATDDSADEQLLPTEEEKPVTDVADDTTDSEFECGPGELFADIVGDEATYLDAFSGTIHPVSDFLAALASTDGHCVVMTAHFWRDPYRTARIAGLPWEAAVLLGGGDWQAVYEAVDVELHQVRTTGGAGPIWVRTN